MRTADDHGIDMNFSAEKASRKWAYGAFGRREAAIVTAAAVLLWLGAEVGPAAAARRSALVPWADLFGGGPPKLRGTVHRSAVPLPKPRPAEAPVAAPEEPPAAEKR